MEGNNDAEFDTGHISLFLQPNVGNHFMGLFTHTCIYIYAHIQHVCIYIQIHVWTVYIAKEEENLANSL